VEFYSKNEANDSKLNFKGGPVGRYGNNGQKIDKSRLRQSQNAAIYVQLPFEKKYNPLKIWYL
jgi:hypothetical protein